MNPVCVELPWPPIKSSPNGSQGDWRGKARAGRGYKRDCWAVIKAAGIAPMSASEVEVNIIFCPPDNRRRDLDGCLHRRGRVGGVLQLTCGSRQALRQRRVCHGPMLPQEAPVDPAPRRQDPSRPALEPSGAAPRSPRAG